MKSQRRLLLVIIAVLMWTDAVAESLYSGMEDFVVRAKALTKKSIVEVEAAAKAGRPDAQVVLGFAFLEGTGGLAASSRDAANQFESAAMQGQVYGELMIAMLYFEGRGVDKDAATAMKWFEMAAMHGNPEAFYMLGNVTALGAPGVEKNLVEAHKWFTLAMASTTNADKRRAFEISSKLAEKGLKPEELEVSRKLAREWLLRREHQKAIESAR